MTSSRPAIAFGKPTRARDRLMQAAEKLFYAEGIHAVGVERLLAVSGVARASFYRHFATS